MRLRQKVGEIDMGAVATVIAILALIILIAMYARGSNAIDQQENSGRFKKQDYGNITVLVDRETGVEYIKYANSSLTPLYNSDGSLRIANGWRDDGS